MTCASAVTEYPQQTPSSAQQLFIMPDEHMIHLQPKRIIGSGSFGKEPSLLICLL